MTFPVGVSQRKAFPLNLNASATVIIIIEVELDSTSTTVPICRRLNYNNYNRRLHIIVIVIRLHRRLLRLLHRDFPPSKVSTSSAIADDGITTITTIWKLRFICCMLYFILTSISLNSLDRKRIVLNSGHFCLK